MQRARPILIATVAIAVLFLLSSAASVNAIFSNHSNQSSGIYGESEGLAAVSSEGLSSKTLATCTNCVTANVTVGNSPNPGAYDAGNGDIYVPNGGSNDVSVLSGVNNSLIATVPVGNLPWTPTYDSLNGKIYVPNIESNNVSVISGLTNKVVASIGVDLKSSNNGVPLTLDTSNGDLYVPNGGASLGNISIISGTTNSIVRNLTIGSQTDPIGFDPSNGDVYAPTLNSTTGDSQLDVISEVTNTVSGSIGLGGFGGEQSRPVFDPANRDFYVAEGNGTTMVVSTVTKSLVATVPSSDWGETPAFDSTNGEIYAPAGSAGSNVTVINGSTNKVLTVIATADAPDTPLIHLGNGEVYVPNFIVGCGRGYLGSVTVISSSKNVLVKNIGVGYCPEGATYDPSNGDIYVSNSNSDNVSVISGGSPGDTVSFAIPGGVCGPIAVSNSTFSGSFFNSEQAVVPPGTFTLSAPACSGYTFEGFSGSGAVHVSGHQATVNGDGTILASFVSAYPVTFTMTGLPSVTEWWVNLTNGQSFHSEKSTITFKESNGTFQYVIATSDKEYNAKGGSFTVDGKKVSKTLKFTLVTYQVTFTEFGLPSGTKWWVNLTNGQSFDSTAASISFNESNGSYSFKTSAAAKGYKGPSGKFTIDGAKLSKTVRFTDPNGGLIDTTRTPIEVLIRQRSSVSVDSD
jgi:YVTN family beta-propeller protein